MTSHILAFSNLIINLFSVVLILFSLLYCFRDYNPGYMRSFPVYCIGNVLANIFNSFFPSTTPVVYTLFTAFELIYFCYFLTILIESSKTKKLVWILAGLTLIFMIYHVIKKDIEVFIDMAVLFECIILIIPCLVYFREIFSKPQIVELKKEPSFWMVTGILFYFFLLIPTLFFSSYFHHFKMTAIGDAFYSVNNFAQIISYVLFIKAMRCRRKISF